MLDEAKADMDAEDLQKALDYIRARNLYGYLQRDVQEAERLLHQLQKTDHMKHSELNMDRSTISEMRSYRHPPDAVRKVMTASLLILGEDEHTSKVLLALGGPHYTAMHDKFCKRNWVFRTYQVQQTSRHTCEQVHLGFISIQAYYQAFVVFSYHGPQCPL